MLNSLLIEFIYLFIYEYNEIDSVINKSQIKNIFHLQWLKRNNLKWMKN